MIAPNNDHHYTTTILTRQNAKTQHLDALKRYHYHHSTREAHITARKGPNDRWIRPKRFIRPSCLGLRCIFFSFKFPIFLLQVTNRFLFGLCIHHHHHHQITTITITDNNDNSDRGLETAAAPFDATICSIFVTKYLNESFYIITLKNEN